MANAPKTNHMLTPDTRHKLIAQLSTRSREDLMELLQADFHAARSKFIIQSLKDWTQLMEDKYENDPEVLQYTWLNSMIKEMIKRAESEWEDHHKDSPNYRYIAGT